MPDEGPPRSADPVALAASNPLAAAPAKAAAPTPPKKRFVNPLRPFSEQSSLFGEILDWMLAPLLLLWPMSVALTFVVTQTIADAPFDRHLGETATIIADHLKVTKGEVDLQLPLTVSEVLRADDSVSVHYMVLGLRGEFVAGDVELPIPAEDEVPAARVVRFRLERLRGEEIRVAYTWVEFNSAAGPRYALVQVAESLEKRSQLANEIIRGVIIPQFFVLPLAVLLVWFGLSRGLAPLAALQTRIRARRPDDLSPIDPTAAPEEISPLVVSFNDLLARLAQNLRAQQRFLADAAHQMKTPLAGLRTQAELALRETDPDELRRTLRHIARSTERATHLTNQLLALARAEHRSSGNHFEVVDLVPLAREVVRERVAEAIAHALDLGFEGSDKPVRIVAAPLLIRELLKNLVDNALRYTPANGTITVRVRQEGDCALIEVEDSGPGIPESERQRVFDRFYRVLGTNVDGSGLGLAIVREIAQQHDALVRLSANPSAPLDGPPGTLIGVEFAAITVDPASLDLDTGAAA